MATLSVRNVDPVEAVRFFAEKSRLLRGSFDWREVWQEEHARQFTVAKSAGRNVLEDIYTAAKDAVANGTTFTDFQRRLTPTLQAKGWWGGSMEVDPLTGEPVQVQLGSPRRLRIIFDTNLRMAYAAGRWERIQRIKEDRPYLMYDAVNDSRTRPEHRAWDGTVLPADHEWWRTHYPPNGWNCRCTVISLSERQYRQLAGTGRIRTDPPPVEMVSYENRRTGQTIQVPRGIDPGFAYNVGVAHLRDMTPPPLPGRPRTGADLFPASGRPPLPSPRPIMPVPASDRGRRAWDIARDEIERAAEARPGRVIAVRDDSAVITDPIGLPIAVSERFFRPGARDARHVVHTLLDPDEIWLSFDHARSGYRLSRFYLSRRESPSGPVVSVIEETRDGWRGVSTHAEGQINLWRRGWLAYRRQK